MLTNEQTPITDKTKVAELTVGEFRKVIRAEMDRTLFDFLWELQQYLPDPDEGLEFKPEVAQRLRQFIQNKETDKVVGKPLEAITREPELDE
jgi:hypothetical protein